VVRGASARTEAILDVLHLSRLVGVREPVLAHEGVVGEADGAAGHEDLGDGEARHWGWDGGRQGRCREEWVGASAVV
jgi:hypothetical protein